MYLVRTDDELHVCSSGKLVIVVSSSSRASDRDTYLLCWIDGELERTIIVCNSRTEAEDLLDEIWDSWKKGKPADIAYS